MYHEKKANIEALNLLLDLKTKTNRVKKHKDGEAEEVAERVIDGQLSIDMVRKKDFQSDVLPFIYLMIHPHVRPINS